MNYVEGSLVHRRAETTADTTFFAPRSTCRGSVQWRKVLEEGVHATLADLTKARMRRVVCQPDSLPYVAGA
jgi:hypothetical protein